MACPITGIPMPVNGELPVAIERRSDLRGDNYVLHWSKVIEFDNGEKTKTKWVSTKKHGVAEAERRVWQYFEERSKHGQTERSPAGTGRTGALTALILLDMIGH